MHTFFIAPTGFGVGLIPISPGLLRALECAGLEVGFSRPIARLHPGDLGPEYSSELVMRIRGLDTPKPLLLAQAEWMLGDGQLDGLLEEIISLYQYAAADKDVVIVEGMVPIRHASYAAWVNLRLVKSFDAEVILVSAPENKTPTELTDRIKIQVQLFGGPCDPKVSGVILNKVHGEADVTNAEDGVADFARRLIEHSPLLRDDFRLIGCILQQDGLNVARIRDIAGPFSVRVINAGNYEQRWVQKIVLCVHAVPNTAQLLKPSVLVVTPGDHDDIILATSLVVMNSVPLAGLLLCNDFPSDPRITELCHGALQGGLPVLSMATGSYDTATNLNRMNKEIPVDDRKRAEQATELVVGHTDFEWFKQRCGMPHELRLSPPTLHYQVVQRAQKAGKRIVLPKDSEPRTVQVAVICQARGIACCVLLAKPDEVQAVAQAQGTVPLEGLEIIDLDLVRQRYVEPMVELRKGKGLNAPMAEQQLEDSVVLATMMLTLDEADGLVSDAIHTTASTICPVLQLTKTAFGHNLVSSVLFMLLSGQVLVYGDCAVNLDPSAGDLAEIAMWSAVSAQAFGIPAWVAMISYSTGDSGSGVDVDKVREATRLAREQHPDLLVDGSSQYDVVVIASVGRQEVLNSSAAGQATASIFPDLDTSNATCKVVQRSADCVSVGPMLQGLRKPVDDLSRDALVEDIVYTIALTAIQADVQAPA